MFLGLPREAKNASCGNDSGRHRERSEAIHQKPLLQYNFDGGYLW